MIVHSVKITEKAVELDCSQEVAGMSNIQAVRYLQQREGHTRCFAQHVPLVPAANSGASAFCGISECCWKLDCDSSTTWAGTDQRVEIGGGNDGITS
jgi:hypothetical protein